MIKTFIAGVIVGIVGVAGALYAVPAVDQHREASLVSVRANGGNIERFHVSVPEDRIMVGGPGTPRTVPGGLAWSDQALLRETTAELFKLRNEEDVVIGVASRLAARGINDEAVIEWVLHMPARGSLYATMNDQSGPDALRGGVVRHGTREFASRTGLLAERFVPVAGGSAETEAQGRIELETALVGVADEIS
mgnify:FL=1